MMSLPRSALALAALLVLVAPDPGATQQQTDKPGVTVQETKSTMPYHPGLGTLMTAIVQPRHIKLGLAGNERNWPYAAYQLGELTETFDEMVKLVPKYANLSIPDAIASTVKQPMAALDAAIKAMDAAAFTKAYADFTASCNACHQSAARPMIVIQVPTVSAFPDQDFRPQQK
jgi:hypothetical protein